MKNKHSIMENIYLRYNLPSFSFSILLFLFAIEPLLVKSNVINHIVWSLIILSGLIWLFSCIVLIIKDKHNFIINLTSTSQCLFFNIASALIGVIISYSLNSYLIKLWIFLLIIFIVSVLIPDPFKK